MRVVDDSLFVRANGEGPPIVFVHGNSCSSRSFEHQLGSELLSSRYRLLAVDLPGHGDSRAAAVPRQTYRLAGYADALAAAARELDAEDALFVGWSLGGHVVLEATDRLPRARGIVIFGAPPISSFADFGRASYEAPEIGVAFREDSTEQEIRELVAKFVRRGADVPDRFVEDFVRTDKRTRSAIAASASENDLRDEIAIVTEMTVPLAVFHGAHDQLFRRSYYDEIAMPTLWRGAVQEIPNAGHAPQWENPTRFNQLLDEFARDCLAARA